ncbi:trimethylguanosine synthase-like [Schistocerca gregaria]|uniref:trimethylguanosine synthase-like n=1 Tax=Schistocerca gregaria TaxID=7010 RepID=UPI00211E8494|nr:trimethylguanosine synthase-like [Schistocerca gregaria]
MEKMAEEGESGEIEDESDGDSGLESMGVVGGRKRRRKIDAELKHYLGLRKYWGQRFRIFSRFNEGVKLDAESWYSVTPELVAIHIARRMNEALSNGRATEGEGSPDGYRPTIILDGFCGAGGNLIQFSLHSHASSLVIGIDIRPEKVQMARHNAEVYGADGKVEFIIGDYLRIAPRLRAVNAVFLSPPWGGPSYKLKKRFCLDQIVPAGGAELIRCAQRASENIAFYLPRNIAVGDVIDCSRVGHPVEIERNILNGKLKSMVAYYGRLVKLGGSPVSIVRRGGASRARLSDGE